MGTQIANNLYLYSIVTPNKVEAAPPSAINHVIVIDCSGSMAGELASIREQLKSKLPKMLGVNDTVSIIWFSGRGECGVLVEGEPVATLVDLKNINQAIDRWLRPIGLTGFVEPLRLIQKVSQSVVQKTGNDVFSVFFMSDGADNQWSDKEIVNAAQCVQAVSVTVVEYGYYADRVRLSKIAEATGGVLVFAKDFDQYSPTFENAITKPISAAPQVSLSVGCDPIGDFVFALDGDEIRTFLVVDRKFVAPAHIGEYHYLTNHWDVSHNDIISAETEATALYAALSLYATRMQPDIVRSILRRLGDVKFINQFACCFGKDKYTAFQEEARQAALNKSLRLMEGFDPNLVPREDAFTVLELLEALTEKDKLMLDHPLFKFSRISRRRESKAGKVDQSELEAAKTALDGGDLDAVNAALAKLGEIKRKAETPELKFFPYPVAGYSVSGLVIPEDRANISIRVRKIGAVDLTEALRTTSYSAVMIPQHLPTMFPTYVWRNIPIVSNGMVNAAVLPLRLSAATAENIAIAIGNGRLNQEVVEILVEEDIVLFHLDMIPVVNGLMVKAPSAQTMFDFECQLLDAQAAKKVYDHYRKELFPKESTSFADQYGKEAADWLKEQGITDYGGFAPKSEQAESTDFYMAKELKVSISKFSSLPSVADVKKRMTDGKLTPAAALMAPYIEEVEAKRTEMGAMFERWLIGAVDKIVAEVRSLQLRLAKIKFAILVGQVWFVEFKSLDDNMMKVTINGQVVDGTVEQKLVKVTI